MDFNIVIYFDCVSVYFRRSHTFIGVLIWWLIKVEACTSTPLSRCYGDRGNYWLLMSEAVVLFIMPLYLLKQIVYSWLHVSMILSVLLTREDSRPEL